MIRRWKHSLVALPGVGVSLLPKVVCPMCSPVAAALLSTLGLGFLVSGSHLLPLTVLLLSVVLMTLFVRASTRRGQGPFWTAVIASVCVLVGKFWVDSRTVTYVGVGLLGCASVWNAIPRRSSDPCPRCLPAGPTLKEPEGN